ncbi:MAG: sulfotransferase domain-containing protein [Pseudomonadota bacterium]
MTPPRLPLGAVRRARTMDEFALLSEISTTQASIDHSTQLEPRPDDVIISTYPKCGTTWMQQIVHGLRSGASMAFGEISEVVPFMEVAHDCGIDLNAPQAFAPRAFKTHYGADELPAGAKYIVVLRDPMDACISFYNFMVGWYLEPGTVSVETYTEESFLKAKGSWRYWTHLASWWPKRNEDTVLMFCFEDIKNDPAAAISQVARFMGLAPDAALERLVLEQSSIEFMRAHKHQFDDNLLRRARDEVMGLPADGESSKVKTGKVGASKALLPERLRVRFEDAWREEALPVTGAASYEELRAMV